MKPLAILFATLLAACGSAAAPASPQGPAADAAHPVVVELYQSQGCSSCPPAIANVNALADRPGVLPLIFAVTYWDQLGWKDTFDDPAYTARQWDYARAQHRGNVATPQTIVDGRVAINGGDAGELNRTIAASRRGASGPAIASSGRKVMVGAGQGSGLVWLVRYDPRALSVPIRAGENGGKTLVHRNIVRGLTMLGNWRGNSASFAIPGGNATDRQAILIQQGRGGPIVAAARI